MRSYVVPVRMHRYYALLFMRNNVDLFRTTYSSLPSGRPMDTCMYASLLERERCARETPVPARKKILCIRLLVIFVTGDGHS